MIVSKFGGTSLADARQIKKAAAIVTQSPERSVVVVSAPGKRSSEDEKITDILISCHAIASEGGDIADRYALVRDRYTAIAADLGIETDLAPVLDEVERDIRDGADQSAVVSRGEYLGAHLVASYLGYEFADAAEMIRFADETTIDSRATDELVRKRLDPAGRFVVPGFYGAHADGRVQLFSRGGSDISAALIARALDAKVYENWTDVSGLLSADPRIVDNPAPITRVSYRELRELAFLGANVFHDEAIAPVAQKGIPIQIRNTNEPDHPGTTISRSGGTSDVSSGGESPRVVGVAGKRGFQTVLVERSMLSARPRYLDEVRSVCMELTVPVRHSVAGSDTLLLVCPAADIDRVGKRLDARLRENGAEQVDSGPPVALVGMVWSAAGVDSEVLSRGLGGLAREGIAVRFVSSGESPHTVLFGVDESRYEDAIRALYRSTFDQ